MEIKYETKYLLNTIHIHDSEFTGYSYDYDKRNLIFSCKNIFQKKTISFSFENVVLLHFQSCSFWHGGNSILWMTVHDTNEFLDDLIKQQRCNAERYEGSVLDQGIQFLIIEFTLNSGDTLLIVSESVIHSETSLLS